MKYLIYSTLIWLGLTFGVMAEPYKYVLTALVHDDDHFECVIENAVDTVKTDAMVMHVTVLPPTTVEMKIYSDFKHQKNQANFYQIDTFILHMNDDWNITYHPDTPLVVTTLIDNLTGKMLVMVGPSDKSIEHVLACHVEID
jgi:hypothetical protein